MFNNAAALRPSRCPHALLCQQCGVAEQHLLPPPDKELTPRLRSVQNCSDWASYGASFSSCARAYKMRQRMTGSLFDSHHLWPALGEDTGFIEHPCIDFGHLLQRIGIAHQHAEFRGAADAGNNENIGVARPKAQVQTIQRSALASAIATTTSTNTLKSGRLIALWRVCLLYACRTSRMILANVVWFPLAWC